MEARASRVEATNEGCVTAAIKSLKKTDIARFVGEMADAMSTHDWAAHRLQG